MSVKKMYINNQWVLSKGEEIRNIINPATEEIIAQVTEGTVEDAKIAIQAAQKAFYEDGWGETHARHHAQLLFNVADKLEKEIESFSQLETLNNGKPLRESTYDIEDAVNQLRYYAGLATKPSGQVYDVPDDIQAFVVKEPIGVVGQIVPWNYPLVLTGEATNKVELAESLVLSD